MLRILISYLMLPAEISRFEREYLQRVTRVGLGFFYAHLPAIMIVAFLAKTSVIRAGLYTALALVGPTIAFTTFKNPRHITRTYAFTAMVIGGILVHFGQGSMQIEMHFYFFVLIALLAVFADPLVILMAALTVALHHLMFYFFAPASVFNYEASIWAVVVHALFVVLESIAACFVARSFFDNVIGLERIVSRRTEELAQRTEQMAVVLKNIEQGLVVVHADGSVGPEQSARLEALIGPRPTSSDRIWDWIKQADPTVGDWVEVGWSMLTDDFLPLEVAIDQLPSRFHTKEGRVLQLAYQPLGKNNNSDNNKSATAAFNGLLFVVTDVTSEAERERYESEQREMLVLFERAIKDRNGLLEFAAEASDIVNVVTDENKSVELHVAKRLVHTLKGNAGLFGCGALVRVCHEIESRVEEAGCLVPSDRVELRVSWDQVHQKLGRLVLRDDDETASLHVDHKEHRAVVQALRDGSNRARIVEMLEDWTLEPTELRLKRLAEQARSIASRLGKGEIEVELAPHGVRLCPDRLRPFWASLLHVIRNAADHGLEAPAERAAAGKSGLGTIGLTTRLTEQSLIVEVSDNGRGIDWEKVRSGAVAKGIAADSAADLTAALFTDGVTTRDTVSEHSGRGIGMSAIAAKCKELGGTIDIRSELGQGTTVTIALPRRQVLKAARAATGTTSLLAASAASTSASPSNHDSLRLGERVLASVA